jgi:hypothetical protein
MTSACPMKRLRQSTIFTQQWTSLDGGAPEVYRHACACMDCGQDAGRVHIDWASAPLRAALGQDIQVRLSLTAPGDRFVTLAAAAVLVRPAHDRRINGPVIEQLIGAGEQGMIMCPLSAPTDISPGVHEVAVIAIINGAFVQRSYTIEIETPRVVRRVDPPAT